MKPLIIPGSCLGIKYGSINPFLIFQIKTNYAANSRRPDALNCPETIEKNMRLGPPFFFLLSLSTICDALGRQKIDGRRWSAFQLNPDHYK